MCFSRTRGVLLWWTVSQTKVVEIQTPRGHNILTNHKKTTELAPEAVLMRHTWLRPRSSPNCEVPPPSVALVSFQVSWLPGFAVSCLVPVYHRILCFARTRCVSWYRSRNAHHLYVQWISVSRCRASPVRLYLARSPLHQHGRRKSSCLISGKL